MLAALAAVVDYFVSILLNLEVYTNAWHIAVWVGAYPVVQAFVHLYTWCLFVSVPQYVLLVLVSCRTAFTLARVG